MGEHDVDQQFDEKTSQAFMKALLEDLRALEYMIATGGFEDWSIGYGRHLERLLIPEPRFPINLMHRILARG